MMETCENGSLNNIFEIVEIAGGLINTKESIIASVTSFNHQLSLCSFATSCGDIFLFCHKNNKSTTKIIPWSIDDNRKPAALAFSPTLEWLLVANDDGSICIVPIGKFVENIGTACDYRFSVDDVMILQPHGSRTKPTSILWWQTLNSGSSIAIVGTELGELCFVELTSGKDVGGTYITVPVIRLHLCMENTSDTVYLLITGTEDRQWRLVLEQKSRNYLFPLENITPEWGIGEDSFINPLPTLTTPTPRSRLLGLKQLSVEKLQLLKQRLSDAKQSSRKKPMTENKGVDTCDIDELPSPNTTIITPHIDSVLSSANNAVSNSSTPTTAAKIISPAIENLNLPNEGDNPNLINTRPEKLNKYLLDVVASPQFAKGKHLIAGHHKANSCLMVYSTDLESTPLYVHKVPEDTKQIIFHDELIFVTSRSQPTKISILSTVFTASSKIDGEIDKKINPLLQEIYLPEGEEIINFFSAPSVLTEQSKDNFDEVSLTEVEAELPSCTKPSGCIIFTKSSMYYCQVRKSIEHLFMEFTLRAGDTEAAHKLSVIFSLDQTLFEIAGNAKLVDRNFVSALSLYKHSKSSHVKCSLKFAWAGFVPEFLTYMGSLMNGSGGPDMTADQRQHLATLAIIAHLHQLSLPAGIRTLHQQQTTLKTLLLHLRNNYHYDEILTLVLAAVTWRWETLQYLASSRGLLLEKLHVLLSQKFSSVIGSTMCRKNEIGFLHCLSDPELRAVLLLKPNLARGHISFVLDHLDTFTSVVLRRLTSLYDPTRPAMTPYFPYFHKPNIYGSQQRNAQSSFLPLSNDDPIDFDVIAQVFLAVLIKLNQKRGWKYSPNLLTINSREPSKVEPFCDSNIPRKYLACGYGHSVASLGGSTFSWGLWDPSALGHGPKLTINQNIMRDLDSSLQNELKELALLLNPNSTELIFSSNESSTSTPSTQMNDHDYCKPKAISYLANMKMYQISCGKHHTLAITNYGVYGWGSSKYGQLGIGTTGKFPRPTLVASLIKSNVIQVSCGQFHSLAVTLDGRLLTWGWGVHGQLGHGTVNDCHKPTQVNYLSKVKILQAYGGYAHSVALSDKGIVYAWGCSTYGQVGTGGISKVIVPSRVPINKFVTHLSSGYFHNVSVTTDHSVYVWGSNPACLRVQAQLQRKNRQQRADEQKQQQENDTEIRDPEIDCNALQQPLSAIESCSFAATETEIPQPIAACNLNGLKTPVTPCLISANTVPSCDPLELGHLLPKRIEMPEDYGETKYVAAGTEHTLLLTTQGLLYAWGRNMSGQLGTGNRKESLMPVQILKEVHIIEMAVGATYNLALDNQGKLWGWGSNYYGQLGLDSGNPDVKMQVDKVFVLRTSRRVVKVPHSVQSNTETPRIVNDLPVVPQSISKGGSSMSNQKIDLNKLNILKGIQLQMLETNCVESSDQVNVDDIDDELYGQVTLHASLAILHPHYSSKVIFKLLSDCGAHQGLATLYTLERQHSKAMHHQLCAVLTHPWKEHDEEKTAIEGDDKDKTYSTLHITEAVRILDHYLHLQTEESQSGMRGVLEEGIGLWLTHSLPIPELEDLLLTHLPRTVYPLALLLFGDEKSCNSQGEDVDESAKDKIEEATAKVLSRLSTKFCLNLCSSVITHLQSGEASEEQLGALSQMIQTNLCKDSAQASTSGSPSDSQIKTTLENSVDTEQEDKLENNLAQQRSTEEESNKDCVRFTCGHHFTCDDFTEKVLPQLEKTVTTVPGLLGKTARVLLDQYHTDQPQMACPHCVLAHLTIKLTKHNQDAT